MKIIQSLHNIPALPLIRASCIKEKSELLFCNQAGGPFEQARTLAAGLMRYAWG
ncbi:MULTISPECIES: hypothetical protein [Pseudomonas]|uniref:hypothetical protein n=1 Tax=Pseudomonas TaxID=286 RepID=UPI0012FEED63|nr:MULTISPECIES: hypothetical protein [Pseudomonas]MCP3792519.1 hypothetical protein [Pseudomonas sp. N2-11]